jgi:hypothetical protein
MKTLSAEPQIITMANALRLGDGDPVKNILDFCRGKIAKWIQECGPVRTVWDLEKIVCQQLNLTIEHVWSDEDLDKIINSYVQEGDFIFEILKKDLDEQTFATLIRRKSTSAKSEDRYVAVIDCRGQKGPRRVFSRWHEIAHILTLYKQMELPLHRSTVEKDPIEKMMDLIAGEICFYGPMFLPVLQEKVRSFRRLSFDAVNSIREDFYPEVSFQATLNACVAHINTPALLLEIGMGLKKTELRRIQSKQMNLLPEALPKPQLRVLSSMSNLAARQISLQIPRFMRVPSRSILTSIFKGKTDPLTTAGEAQENLVWWTSSKGGALSPAQVNIQAIKVNDRLFAIVSLASAKWN